ncbi:MAG: hypothetical protein IKT39_02630 [Clostridia bacterium]|nr:hypothetical protein [Clostridia bacterium]
MKIFEKLSTKSLTLISNYSHIIGVILILFGLFKLPLGLIGIILGVVLCFVGHFTGRESNKRNQEEFELRRSLGRTEWGNRSRMVMPSDSPISDATNSSNCLSHYFDKTSPYYGSDLIESSDTPFVCSECAKYTKRWFSEFGKNPKYPKLPDYFKQHLSEHEDCAIRFFPVLDNISIPAWEYKGNLVEFCNRPFVDSRTAEEKKVFEDYIAEKERKFAIRAEYDWICKNLPNHAPKSLGGYTRMKNLNSENYQNIKKLALGKGKELV